MLLGAGVRGVPLNRGGLWRGEVECGGRKAKLRMPSALYSCAHHVNSTADGFIPSLNIFERRPLTSRPSLVWPRLRAAPCCSGCAARPRRSPDMKASSSMISISRSNGVTTSRARASFQYLVAMINMAKCEARSEVRGSIVHAVLLPAAPVSRRAARGGRAPVERQPAPRWHRTAPPRPVCSHSHHHKPRNITHERSGWPIHGASRLLLFL